ncbi:hypothetical protein G6F56_001130 [Rhizopus delemar]|nr:hypothetical protein G6F56_001130 [Rhizopus delemar]
MFKRFLSTRSATTQLLRTQRKASSFTTVDKAEVQKFSDKAAEWWDPSGEFGMLQLLNTPRVSYVRDQLVGSGSEASKGGKPFEGKRMLDIGCGGGLFSEVRYSNKWLYSCVK